MEGEVHGGDDFGPVKHGLGLDRRVNPGVEVAIGVAIPGPPDNAFMHAELSVSWTSSRQ